MNDTGELQFADSAPSPPPAAESINPAALTVAQAARLLGVAEQVVRDHVAGGLPTAGGQPDGRAATINLVHYVAWLNLRLAETDGD
jgi:hypothetical protein